MYELLSFLALPAPEEIGNNFFNLGSGPPGIGPPGIGPPGIGPPRGMPPIMLMRGPPRPPPPGIFSHSLSQNWKSWGAFMLLITYLQGGD